MRRFGIHSTAYCFRSTRLRHWMWWRILRMREAADVHARPSMLFLSLLTAWGGEMWSYRSVPSPGTLRCRWRVEQLYSIFAGNNKDWAVTFHMVYHCRCSHLSHLSVVSWAGLTFCIFSNQLSMSDSHSVRTLFFIISSFKRSIHLNVGLPLGRDPSISVFSTDFAKLSSSLLCTCPNHGSIFFVNKDGISLSLLQDITSLPSKKHIRWQQTSTLSAYLESTHRIISVIWTYSKCSQVYDMFVHSVIEHINSTHTISR